MGNIILKKKKKEKKKKKKKNILNYLTGIFRDVL